MTGLPAPYYADEAVTLYHADSLWLIPDLPEFDALITDPPYSSGGAFRSDRTKSTVEKYVQSGTAAYRHDFAGDNRDQRAFATWCALWLSAAHARARSGAALAVFTDWRQLPTVTDAVQVAGWTWRGVAVWDKGFGRPTPGRFSNAAEYVVWGSKGPMPERDAYPGGVFRSMPVRERQHVTEKPEAVMSWLLEVVTPGGLVLDPFAGSGTTLKVAKERGFTVIGCELDPHYVEVAARRCAETLPLMSSPPLEPEPDLFEDAR